MQPTQREGRPTVRQLAKAHTFRLLTAIATWVLLAAIFLYHPEWLTAWLRLVTRSIEAGADLIPSPWGARLEFLMKEIGGFIWFQIASAIVLFRLILWVPFHIWRLRRDRQSLGNRGAEKA
jgi:predicted ferric reductase